MPSLKKTKSDFLAMWSSEGLECVIDLSAWKQKVDIWEKSEIWSILKEEAHGIAPSIPLKQMILRARVNSQRVYEIYTFTVTDGITKQDVEELFATSPQYIVDFIRKNGYKVYSDYSNQTAKVIT